ncbi:hypothetical protein [Streptomyces sp. NPDC093094]|uniref:hypothetical protein n=1 Tax=Streptomyces sp. NPDC093094 TaxID=3366026 RepID=UPI0037F1C078
MGTAERRETPGRGTAARVAVRGGAKAPDLGLPGNARRATDEPGTATTTVRDTWAERDGAMRDASAGGTAHPRDTGSTVRRSAYRPLWVEEPATRRRLPDPVRRAAVRAVLIIALTLIQAMIAFLSTLAGSWLAFPMILSSVASTVAATWGVLDVWVTRQVWNQRNGVVSIPSSTARALRRERRRTRRQARAVARAQERIRRPGGAGQLSHS